MFSVNSSPLFELNICIPFHWFHSTLCINIYIVITKGFTSDTAFTMKFPKTVSPQISGFARVLQKCYPLCPSSLLFFEVLLLTLSFALFLFLLDGLFSCEKNVTFLSDFQLLCILCIKNLTC